MDNINIIKELGHGMVGTVYLISRKNKKYALKIEHVLEKDLKNNNKSSVWREINFCEKFANKYPNQFIQLKSYDFLDNCKHKQHYDFSIKKADKILAELQKSHYCSRKIFTLVDNTLYNIKHTLNKQQWYSMIIQVAYIGYLMHSHHYVHGDLHTSNIGIVKTDKKYMRIFGHNIQTYGLICKAIDYGFVMNKNDISNNKERKKYNLLVKDEINKLKYDLVETKLWDYIDKNKIKTTNFELLLKQIETTEEIKNIKKITSNENEHIFLFELLYPELFQRMLLKNNYKKTYSYQSRIPIEDIIFLIKNSHKGEKIIIEYFTNKLKYCI